MLLFAVAVAAFGEFVCAETVVCVWKTFNTISSSAWELCLAELFVCFRSVVFHVVQTEWAMLGMKSFFFHDQPHGSGCRFVSVFNSAIYTAKREVIVLGRRCKWQHFGCNGKHVCEMIIAFVMRDYYINKIEWNWMTLCVSECVTRTNETTHSDFDFFRATAVGAAVVFNWLVFGRCTTQESKLPNTLAAVFVCCRC